MQCKWTSGSRRNWPAVVGMVLCLLAAVFAIEAKLGWYSPDTTARVELSASKLPGDEAPKLFDNAVSTPAPVLNLLPQAIMFSALLLQVVPVSSAQVVPAPRAPRTVSGAFLPQFLRPPPRG